MHPRREGRGEPRRDHGAHFQEEQRSRERGRHDESALHVDELGVRSVLQRDRPRLERHAADRARTRSGSDDLGVHRARVLDAGDRGRRRRGRGRSAGAAVAGPPSARATPPDLPPRYFPGSRRNFSRQPALQKKKSFPSWTTECFVVAGSTSMPQTRSFTVPGGWASGQRWKRHRVHGSPLAASARSAISITQGRGWDRGPERALPDPTSGGFAPSRACRRPGRRGARERTT